jgi:hypothetical protein
MLIQKPEVKRPVGRHSYRWHDNIKVNIKDCRMGVYGLHSFGPGKGKTAGIF